MPGGRRPGQGSGYRANIKNQELCRSSAQVVNMPQYKYEYSECFTTWPRFRQNGLYSTLLMTPHYIFTCSSQENSEAVGGGVMGRYWQIRSRYSQSRGDSSTTAVPPRRRRSVRDAFAELQTRAESVAKSLYHMSAFNADLISHQVQQV